MPTLIFRGANGKEQRQELGTELSVGRDAGNDLVLADQGISRQHCRFYVDEGGAVWVEDLGSANGVLVAGERIREATEVIDGAEVQVGGWQVRLAAKKSAPAPAARRSGASSPQRSNGKAAIVKQDPAPGGGRRATRMMAAGESPKRARPLPRAAPVASRSDGRPSLRGVSGPFAGSTFDLDKPKILVGRVPPADVLLDDDSVSRRHAEIFKIGPRFSVRDLGSANGTFVNGERISEAPLAPGDAVRFGVVELSFSGPAGAKPAAPGGKKKLILIVGGAAVLVIMILALLLPKPTKPKPTGPEIQPETEDVNRVMGQCRAYADPENDANNWEQAVKVCGHAHDLDPTLGALPLVKKAKRELENEKRLKEAQVKLSTAQEEEAIKILVQVEKESSFFPSARKAFIRAQDILFKHFRNACKGDVNEGYFEQSISSCTRALELTCNLPEGADSDTLKAFEHANRQIGKGKGEYKCPPEYAPFQKLAPTGEDPRLKAEAAFHARYPDATIFRQMMEYYNKGRPKQVANEFKNMRSRNPSMRAVLSPLIENLEIIDGRWATAQEPLRMKRASECLTILKEAFEADARLVPPGLRSSLVQEMSAELAKVFYNSAKDELNKEHLDKAFKNVYEGYKLDPLNTDIANAIVYMERQANDLLNTQPSCETYGYALSITRPESPPHKKAADAAHKAHCPGLE